MKNIASFDELATHLGCDDKSVPYQVGRTLYKYTDCGPWTAFRLNKGIRDSSRRLRDTLYYEDERARNRRLVRHIIGVQIGSIVEGSDVEIGPVTLLFPFSAQQLDEAVKGINDEASFYWQRDNSSWYRVCHGKTSSYFKETWGDIEWERGRRIPAKVKRAAERWAKRGGAPPKANYNDRFPLRGCKGWTVEEFLNDATF